MSHQQTRRARLSPAGSSGGERRVRIADPDSGLCQWTPTPPPRLRPPTTPARIDTLKSIATEGSSNRAVNKAMGMQSSAAPSSPDIPGERRVHVSVPLAGVRLGGAPMPCRRHAARSQFAPSTHRLSSIFRAWIPTSEVRSRAFRRILPLPIASVSASAPWIPYS